MSVNFIWLLCWCCVAVCKAAVSEPGLGANRLALHSKTDSGPLVHHMWREGVYPVCLFAQHRNACVWRRLRVVSTAWSWFSTWPRVLDGPSHLKLHSPVFSGAQSWRQPTATSVLLCGVPAQGLQRFGRFLRLVQARFQTVGAFIRATMGVQRVRGEAASNEHGV